MNYEFDDFAEFFDMETNDYREKIKEEAKKLSFDSVVEGLGLETIANNVAYARKYKFEEGNPISFSWESFNFIAYPDKLDLSRDNFTIKEYRGREVNKFYEELSKMLVETIENYLDNLPF